MHGRQSGGHCRKRLAPAGQGAGDSRLGRPLPESGTLTARLDTDGNATTRQPEDLEAAAAARQTDTVELILSRP